MNRYFAGIGSRETPDDILNIMANVSSSFTQQGFFLRSGGAEGADKAFEKASSGSVIYRPEDATPESIAMAELYHPNWKLCSPYARLLLARNCHIILGDDLKSPVEFVVCWTPGARLVGGTGHSLRLALKHKIKIYNLADQVQYQELRIFYKSQAKP